MIKKLNFFQEIEVVPSNNKKNEHLVGKKGVIYGISEEDEIFYGYAIGLYDDDELLSVDPDEVKPTGKQFKYEDFYDGTHIRVSLDGEIID